MAWPNRQCVAAGARKFARVPAATAVLANPEPTPTVTVETGALNAVAAASGLTTISILVAALGRAFCRVARRQPALHPTAVGRSGPLDDWLWRLAVRQAELLDFTRNVFRIEPAQAGPGQVPVRLKLSTNSKSSVAVV